MAVFSATIAFASARPSRAEHVEARIKELQAKLHITQTQEPLWQNVTQIMRDNAQTMDGLTQARIDKAKSMTAVDNLQSYSAIVEAHAEGLKKFVPAFEALYASMSDAQKHQADNVFREYRDRRANSK
jgi:hypothetical protein